MKSKVILISLSLFMSASAFAAKDYQVTGPVLEVTPVKIVVQKGKDKWEIARDSSTKMDGEPVVGSKVTVSYSMTATDVEVKGKKKK
jgi:hypothetical protein